MSRPLRTLADSRCGLCRRTRVKELIRFQGFVIGLCPDCHSGMVIARFPASDRDPDAYAVLYQSEVTGSKASDCWKLFDDCTGGVMGARSVLDLGCGAGSFLDIAREHGLQTAGIELSANSAKAAADSGHHVHVGSILDAFPSDLRGFEAVTMWDVLEHLAEPRTALERAREAVRPGGRLLLVSPMMGSRYDQLGVIAARVSRGRVEQLLRMCWSEDHLFRFDPRGLCEALLEIGFVRVRARPVLLLSLASASYAGGTFFPDWTPSPWFNRSLSRIGVELARILRLYNKVLVEAIQEG
jgi:SAM-dependent methyltransferase